MSVQDQLREMLHERAAAAPSDAGDYTAVRRRGCRKQRSC